MKTLLLIATFATFALTLSCGGTCKDSNSAACVLERHIVDCTVASVQSLTPQFKPIIAALIEKATGGDGTIDWPSIQASLQGLGVVDGGCILAALENDYLTKRTASPLQGAKATSYHNGFSELRQKMWPNVRFKLGTGVAQ